jgi:hypothetical protein
MTRWPLIFVAAVVMVADAGVPAGAQTRDCQATLQAWAIDPHMPKGCTCPCATCTPQCTSFSGGTFFGTPSSFAAQMAGSLLGGLLAAAFAPIDVDTSTIEAQRAAEEEARQQLAAMNRKFLAEWQAFQAHAAQARATAQVHAERQGQELLGRLHGSEGTPGPAAAPTPAPTPIAGLAGFKWETPPADGPDFARLAQATFDTSGLRDWQRALCAAYFSQMALAVMGTDPERARSLEEQGERAMRGQPVVVACSFPRMQPIPEPGSPVPTAEPPEPSLSLSMKALDLVRARAADLQQIEARLQELRDEKSAAQAAQQHAEAARLQAQAAGAQTRPDEAARLAEIERQLAEAQARREAAAHRADAAARQIEDLEMEKESIRQELEAMQRTLQAGSVK